MGTSATQVRRSQPEQPQEVIHKLVHLQPVCVVCGDTAKYVSPTPKQYLCTLHFLFPPQKDNP